MIKIENTDVFGWEAAIRGMRNPLESWDKSDSAWCKAAEFEDCKSTTPHCPRPDDHFKGDEFCVGAADFELMKKLALAGPDHGKFLRFVTVQCDITAPMYWVAEHDTYKVGTVRNSCSFMHKGTSRPFTLDDFSLSCHIDAGACGIDCEGKFIELLNGIRNAYIEDKNEIIFQYLRQIMPQGYNVRYTWQANYAVLRNIYHARKNHRLPEWHDFCKWIEGLHNYLFAGHDFSGAAAAERCKLFVENNPGVDLDFSSFLAAKEKLGDKEW